MQDVPPVADVQLQLSGAEQGMHLSARFPLPELQPGKKLYERRGTMFLSSLNSQKSFDHFPTLKRDCHIHSTPTGAWLLYETSRKPHWNWGLKKLNPDEEEIVFACDGTKKLSGILRTATNLLGIKEKEAFALIEHLEHIGIISYIKKPSQTPIFPSFGGSKEQFVPLHIFLELTDACNQECIHCYRDSGPGKDNFIDPFELLEKIEYLSYLGTLVCEITGGEPLLHPDIFEIVTTCARNFEVLSIITNGTIIDLEFAELLKGLQEEGSTILVSITLNSHRESFHNRFTKSDRSFKKAGEAITLLSAFDIPIRATMNVVPENVSHVKPTAEYCLSLGATVFGAALVNPFGRGANYKLQNFTPAKLQNFDRHISNLSKKYPNKIVTLPDAAFDFLESPNCGAGTRTITINPTGNIKPCVMFPDSLNFGNIFHSEPEEVLCTKQAFEIESLEAPSEQTCKDCKAAGFCNKCLWRFFVASKKFSFCKKSNLVTEKIEEWISKYNFDKEFEMTFLDNREIQ